MVGKTLESKRKHATIFVLKLFVILSLIITTMIITRLPASASTIVVGVVNANGGVYWRDQPDWSTAIPKARYGVYTNDQVVLECYIRGGTVPPNYNNPLWYKAKIVSGFGIGEGYVNDHFLATGSNVPNVVVAGVPACNSATQNPAPGSQTVINGIQIGWAQNNPHRWGACNVQDFKGNAQHSWVIVSYGYWDSGNTYHSTGPQLVRDGMLFGWFDQQYAANKGGAQGPLGCPLSNEQDASVGVSSVVQQNFQGGSLLWAPGMDHAVKIDFNRWGAVSWALHHLGQKYDVGYCLLFVVQAYNIGQFHNTARLTGGPYGDNASAYQWWYGDTNDQAHPNDTNAPFGSFVVWNAPEARDGSGHIALGLGGGYMLTTEYNGNFAVHIESIAPKHAPRQNNPNYFGWEWPR